MKLKKKNILKRVVNRLPNVTTEAVPQLQKQKKKCCNGKYNVSLLLTLATTCDVVDTVDSLYTLMEPWPLTLESY